MELSARQEWLLVEIKAECTTEPPGDHEVDLPMNDAEDGELPMEPLVERNITSFLDPTEFHEALINASTNITSPS